MNRRRSKMALLALWVLAALALILFCIFRCCSAGRGTGEGDAGNPPNPPGDPAPKWCGAPARYVASHADWSRSPCPATIPAHISPIVSARSGELHVPCA